MPACPSPFGRIKAHPPHAAPGQAIGLLGGSFNPPHAAHRMISETALKRLGLDKVWWIVSPGNPLKKRAERRRWPSGWCCAARWPRTRTSSSPISRPTCRRPTPPRRWPSSSAQPAGALRLDHGRGQPRHLRPLAALARDLHHGADRRGGPAGLAHEGAGLQGRPRLRRPAGCPRPTRRRWRTRPAPAWTFLTGPLSHVSSTALRNKAKARGRQRCQKGTCTGRSCPGESRQAERPTAPDSAGA